MHEDGEVDVRGTYTVVAIASLLNLLTPELTAGVAEFALACQVWPGGAFQLPEGPQRPRAFACEFYMSFLARPCCFRPTKAGLGESQERRRTVRLAAAAASDAPWAASVP